MDEEARRILSNIDPRIIQAVQTLNDNRVNDSPLVPNQGTSSESSRISDANEIVVSNQVFRNLLDVRKDILNFPEYLMQAFFERKGNVSIDTSHSQKRRQDPEEYKDIYRFIYNEIFRRHNTFYYNNIHVLKDIIKNSFDEYTQKNKKMNLNVSEMEVALIYEKVKKYKSERIRNDPIVRKMALYEGKQKGIEYLNSTEPKSFRDFGRSIVKSQRKEQQFKFTPITISEKDVKNNRKDLEKVKEVAFQYENQDSEFDAVCVLMKLCFANRYSDINSLKSDYSYFNLISDYPILRSIDWLGFDWGVKCDQMKQYVTTIPALTLSVYNFNFLLVGVIAELCDNNDRSFVYSDFKKHVQNIFEEFVRNDNAETSEYVTSMVASIIEYDIENGNELLAIGCMLWFEENRKKKRAVIDTPMIMSEVPIEIPLHCFVHYELNVAENVSVICSVYLDGLVVTRCGAIDALSRYIMITDLFNLIPSNNLIQMIFNKYVLQRSSRGEVQILVSKVDNAITAFWKKNTNLQRLLLKDPVSITDKGISRCTPSVSIVKRIIKTEEKEKKKSLKVLKANEFSSLEELKNKFTRKAPLQSHCIAVGIKTTGSISELSQRIWEHWHPEDIETMKQTSNTVMQDEEYRLSEDENYNDDNDGDDGNDGNDSDVMEVDSDYNTCSVCLSCEKEQLVNCSSCSELVCSQCQRTCCEELCRHELCTMCFSEKQGLCNICSQKAEQTIPLTKPSSKRLSSQVNSEEKRRRRRKVT